MEEFGHNIGREFLDLYVRSEGIQMKKADKQNEESEAWIEQIENIHKLVSALNKKRDPKTGKVDFSADPELKQLVDLVASYAPHLVPETGYSFSKEVVNNLKETLNTHVNEISSRISHKTLEIQHTLQRLFEMLQISKQTMREDSEHKRNLVRNLGGGRV